MAFGINDLTDSNLTLHETEKLIANENYNPYRLAHDVGLIKLKEKIIFNDKVQPIELPTSDNLDETFPAIASGWGRLAVRKTLECNFLLLLSVLGNCYI